MDKPRLLIVDDEWNMRNLLRIYLQKEGFAVQEAANAGEALGLLKLSRYDLLLLDVMMPDIDGWEVCRRVREFADLPILMLTARTSTQDKVQGLTLGADDYLTKPFEPEELVARVHSLLRRAKIARQAEALQVAEFRDLRIFPAGREVHIHGQTVDFTPKEFELLLALSRNRQRAFTREELVELVWGNDYLGESRVVDTHVKNIREKTERAGLGYTPIQTIWGIGYRFQQAEERE